MKYAIISHGGKQYHVEEGDTILIDKFDQEIKSDLTFASVLLFRDEETIAIGHPYVNGVHVEAQLVEQVKGEKIRVSKFKAKVRYRKTIGFRPLYTKVLIKKIKTSDTPKKKKS